jgi:predicted transcriptional regulator YheO
MNADMTVIQMAHSWLDKLLNQHKEPEPVHSASPDMDVLTKEILNEAVKRLGKPVSLMNKEEKIRAVELMLERGLFMVKGGVEKAAAVLGVTRFTVYNYLEELRQRKGEDPIQLRRQPTSSAKTARRKRTD